MNVLIAYAGKTGTTEKCAKILKVLVDNATLCDLTKEKPDINDYGCIIVGGSIRMGSLHKEAKKFIEKNKDGLKKKKCAFFICNCFTNNSQEYFTKNIPADLLPKALAMSSFGGEIHMDKYKGIDKVIMKVIDDKVNDSEEVQLYTSSEAIQKFAEKIMKR